MIGVASIRLVLNAIFFISVCSSQLHICNQLISKPKRKERKKTTLSSCMEFLGKKKKKQYLQHKNK